MYRRDSLQKSSEQRKKKDKSKRKRDIIVNFRMSNEEKEILENRINLSGLGKQEFIIDSLLHQQIVVFGNKRLFDKMHTQIAVLYEELNKIKINNNIDFIYVETLRTICELIAGFNCKMSKPNE